MMSHRPLIFGEVLFDCFEDGSRVLGGAPFNVAWNLQAFGSAPLFISRVGEDETGAEVRRRMQGWGMDQSGLQSDPQYPTGSVQVGIRNGEPSFDIVADQAYDHIEADQLPDVASALLYHGSLALRETTSRDALERLRASGAPLFMDVNLRAPWWQAEQISALLDHATWAKLNDHEVAALAPAGGDLPSRAEQLLTRHRLKQIIVTEGAAGAFLLEANGELHRVSPQKNTQVIDTVGAGDAFASVCILGLLRDWPAADTLQRAQQFASALVGVRGATVDDPAFYRPFVEAWGLHPQ